MTGSTLRQISCLLRRHAIAKHSKTPEIDSKWQGNSVHPSVRHTRVM